MIVFTWEEGAKKPIDNKTMLIRQTMKDINFEPDLDSLFTLALLVIVKIARSISKSEFERMAG